MFCVKCGNKMLEDAKFCSKCGHSTNATATNPPPSSGQTTVNHTAVTRNRLERLLPFAKICRAVGFVILTLLFLSTIFGFINLNLVIAIIGALLFLFGEAVIDLHKRKILNFILISITFIAMLILIVVFVLPAANTGGTPGANMAGGSQSPAIQQQASGNRIVIGQTQTFDDDFFGNMEVTLEYVEFSDSFVHSAMGLDTELFPEDGNTFMVVVLTLRNIGTTRGSLMGFNTVVYDGVFEFSQQAISGTHELNPLTEPATAAIAFVVPSSIAQSDESLIVHFEGAFRERFMSFVVRPSSSTTQLPAQTAAPNASLTENEALEIARRFVNDHPLYVRTVTGEVEFEPPGFPWDTTGLFRIALTAPDGGGRSMWVDRETGGVYISPGANVLLTGEEFYYMMFIESTLLFAGTPVHLLSGFTREDIREAFGPPDFADPFWYSYNGVGFGFNDAGVLTLIEAQAQFFEISGFALDTNRFGITDRLGEPISEGWENRAGASYGMRYNIHGVEVLFLLLGEEGHALVESVDVRFD